MSDNPEMDPVTGLLREHYARTFRRFGATTEGVDWGSDQERVDLRYGKMAAVMDVRERQRPSFLDVGCGFGGLFNYLNQHAIEVEYTGIDVVAAMIEHAARSLPDASWICGDILDFPGEQRFDYVVCNGILTQRLAASTTEMDRYAERLIQAMFRLCRRGIAFNLMSTKVNFMVDNLYYRDPVELFAWCLETVTNQVRIDHRYPPLYEYTVYLGRDHPR